MLKHLQKLLLIAALCLPWVTQAQTDSCTIKIVGEDSYGDGWNGGSLAVMQGTTTVTSFTLGTGSDLDSVIVTVASDTPVSFVWTSGSYDSEVTISIYNASEVLLYSVEDPDAGTIFTIANACSNCFAPSGLHVDSLTSDYARLVWAGGADSYGILYGESADVQSGSASSTTSMDTYIELTNLSVGTGYTVKVWTICDDGETSDSTTLFFATIGEPVDVFPYTTGFEADDDVAWSFVNDAVNQWTIGSAVASSGVNSLYISNNNGTSNAYTVTGTQFSYAYRPLSIDEAGQYAVSFDWLCVGESSWDFLRAWIAPATAQFTAGLNPAGGTSTNNYTTTSPDGWIDLGGKMNQQSTWQTATAVADLTEGAYFLVFMWCNDGSAGTQPPAAVDNIDIHALSCPQPTQLTAVPHSFDVDLSWVPAGDESSWEITVSDTLVYYSTSDTYTVTDLDAYTYYHFSVRAICGAGDTSFATTVSNIRTLPSCPQPTDLSVDSVTTSEIYLSWTAGGEETTWLMGLNDSLFEVTDNPIVLTDLTINTSYNITLRALCGDSDTSFVSSVSTRTLAGEPISVFPYTCGFEITDDGDEGANWILENGTEPNYWMVGTATNNGGNRSMYVTDNGTANSYNISGSSTVFAYATFYFAAGEYSYSYDWKADGESSYDYLRAAVVPVSTAVIASVLGGFDNTSGVPSGSVAIDGAYRLNQNSNWTNQSGTFTIANEGLYNVVFMWHNDGSMGTQPPAAIDNIAITPNSCPAPVSLVLDTIEPFQATLDWTAVGDESEWLIRAVNPNDTVDWQSTTTNPYTITGLSSGTTYIFQLVALCGPGDTSNIVSRVGSTPITCPAPTDIAVNNNGTDAVCTWVDPTGSAWELVWGPIGFNPSNAENMGTAYDTTFTITGLDTGFYEVYVRTDCGDDDHSTWAGPVRFSYGIAVVNMAVTGIDTLYACNAVIYDDGGAEGAYSSNCQSTLVIYPSTPGSDVVISGISYTESTYDYLRIYAGAGTDGEELWNDYGVSATQSFGPFSSDAITVVFHSDGSVTYSGFEIYVACAEPESCPKPSQLAVNSSDPANVIVNWVNVANAPAFELAIGTPGFNPDTVNAIPVTDTFYTFNNLLGGVVYEVYVRSSCGGSEYSNWRGPVSFVPGQYIMGTSGSDTITMCGGVIYDDGGADGQYSNNADFTLVVYPADPDSMLVFQGSAYTESSLDYLKIYEGVGTSGNIIWQTSSSSVSEIIPQTVVMAGPITLHFHTDGSVTYSGVELFVSCMTAPECSSVENLVVESGVTSAVVTWTEGYYGTYTGATVEYKVDSDVVWTTLPTVSGDYCVITGLTPGTNYNLRVAANCTSDNSLFTTADFRTGMFPCLQDDPSSVQSILETIGEGTATNQYIPSYSYYNYGLTQQIFTPEEVGYAGTITSVAFMMSAVASQRTYQIYMGHTSDATASQFICPADTTLVYNGGAVTMTANQWTTFTLTTPFVYNGTDNLVVFFRDITGSYTSGNYNYSYGYNSTSGVSRYVYNDNNPYTIGATTGGTSSSFRCNLVLGMTVADCLLADSCAAPVAVVTGVSATTVDVIWAPGYAETSWNVYYRQAGSSTWSTPVTVTTTSYQFSNLNSGTNYEFMIETTCNGNTYSDVVEATTDCAAITNIPFAEDFNSWGTGTDVLPNCWYRTGTYSTYTYISSSYNHSGSTGGSVYMYQSSYAGNRSWLILPAVDVNTVNLSQLQLTYYVYTTSSYAQPDLEIGVMSDPENNSTFVVIDTVYGSDQTNSWELYEVPLTNYSGTGSHVAIRTIDGGSYVYFYIDDVTLEPVPTCLRPDNLASSNATSSTVQLSWHENNTANSWIIEYGPSGFELGTGTVVSTSSNPYTLTGLDAMFHGDFYVRSVCSISDTGAYSRCGTFITTMCDGAAEAYNYDTTQNSTTSSYSPVGYSTYNYSYVQTIVTADHLSDITGDITAMAFNPASTSAGSFFTNMTVWLANVSDDSFDDDFILPDENHVFHKVIDSADFSYSTTGWQIHGFDSSFAWDGNSNILVSVLREHGSWNSGSSFRAHSDTVDRMCYVYRDGSTYDYTTVDGGNTSSTVGDIMLISCGVGCRMPSALNISNVSYASATASWSHASATSFEVAVKASNAGVWPEGTVVNGTNFNITGIMPATTYQFRVRAICDAAAGDYSNWVMASFTTDSLPCFAPTDLALVGTTMSTATFSWTSNGDETAWRIHVWNPNFDQTYDVTTNPATVEGLLQNISYNATVMALCGGVLESDPSNTVEFTTAVCPVPTDVAATNVDAHNATITWNGSASTYSLEYGRGNFATGSGTLVENISGTSYTITGLADEVGYTVQVRAHCDAQNASAWSTRASFTTLVGIDDVEGAKVSIYPNPTSGATTISLNGVNGEVTVTVVDMNGRMVRTETMECAGDCTKRMEVNGLAAGSYFVRIAGEGVNTVKKLVVK